MERIALPAFPCSAAVPGASTLKLRGLRLRPATTADLPFLMQLYAAWRMPELLMMPWTVAQKQTFAQDQFRLQHSHFVHHFAQADFWLVTDAVGRSIGRLSLDRSGTNWRLIDMLLSVEARGRGLGSALLGWVQDEAAATGACVTLHVAVNNPRAHALYRRMGFAEVEGDDPMHQRMQWCPPVDEA